MNKERLSLELGGWKLDVESVHPLPTIHLSPVAPFRRWSGIAFAVKRNTLP
jgi:hypothetical protein